ncbi:MAG: CDP-glucose 4,6-dehydratase [Polyangiaceae bacterium]
MMDLFDGFWRGRRVLVTGHTGFKGSWLTLWLRELGADVTGLSLPPPTSPSHWELLGLDIPQVIGDINEVATVQTALEQSRPEIVFHLAAQPLVRESYRTPVTTFRTNILGSLQLLDVCRVTPSVRAIVCVTTDKVYENREWDWAYREVDPLGGYDRYSASKACLELAVASYRRSFWPSSRYRGEHSTLIATARAGNVIGGGDWALDRLVPDSDAKRCSK